MTRALGERLRRERERRDLYQDQVADRLGVKQPSYNRWEKGGNPAPDKFPAIADFLGLTIEEVYRLTQPDAAEPNSLHLIEELLAAQARDIADLRAQLRDLSGLRAEVQQLRDLLDSLAGAALNAKVKPRANPARRAARR